MTLTDISTFPHFIWFLSWACGVWTSVKHPVMCPQGENYAHALLHQHSEKGWHFQPNISLSWLHGLFTFRQLSLFQWQVCETDRLLRARQIPLRLRRRLTAAATCSKAKLRRKVATHEHTKPALVSWCKLWSQAQTHDGASWCVAMATAELGGEGEGGESGT